MESGGKAVTKRYRKKITVVLSLVLPVILLFAILNCFTTYVFYEDYKYKMNLMTEIAAKEEFSGLDAVSELLKDKDIETNEQGRRLLEQYGYWGNKGNAFYSQFRHQVMVTGAVSTVICVLLLTFLLYWKKKEGACHQKILDQLEEILIRFRENKFDDLLKTENHAELEKLNDQLEAIGHHIQLLKEEAREEKESTKEMVSDISHQLKTPVAALDTCFSVLMQNDLSATEQEEFRIRCRSALDGLETLLQSLLEISKMETGLIQINKKKLPLMDTVISAVNCTYPKADEKEIEFVFDYAKELETCMVMQDKRWLGEAVINVLDNAIKYSPDGSKIFIRLQKRNDLVRMEIEDQGIGIPQNEYHKIFQRFYRGSSRKVMEKSGTGIGRCRRKFLMNITVYLGANEGNDPCLRKAVEELGAWIGNSGNALVYGGSKGGLMGALADSVFKAGGDVTGVEPNFFIENEFQHDGLTKLIVTKDMSERKNKMIELGEAFIAFPGGTGTLEEIAEVMSKVSLKHLEAPCILYNLNGYYDDLKALLNHMIEKGLSSNERQEGIFFVENLDDIKRILRRA